MSNDQWHYYLISYITRNWYWKVIFNRTISWPYKWSFSKEDKIKEIEEFEKNNKCLVNNFIEL